MEIGPITPVRAVSNLKPARNAPDLSRIFEAEYLGQSAEDQYTPENRKAARGLEDEDDDLAQEPGESETSPDAAVRPRGVSFFA